MRTQALDREDNMEIFNQNNFNVKENSGEAIEDVLDDKLITVAPRHPDSRLQSDWLFLYEKLPANRWHDDDYTDKTSDWLNTHSGIHKRQRVLKQLSAEYRMGALNWSNYRWQVLPRIEEHIFKLHQHHSIEDRRYFPRFVAAYPPLKAGFALLERDHERLDTLLDELQMLNNRLAESEMEDRALAERLHNTLVASSTLLSQHLSDEEDLVIPILGLRQD